MLPTEILSPRMARQGGPAELKEGIVGSASFFNTSLSLSLYIYIYI